MNKRFQKFCQTVLCIAILSGGLTGFAQAQYFWNTDFEYGVNKAQPRKWSIEGEGENFTAHLDEKKSRSGQKSLYMSLTNARTHTILNIPGELVSGKTISIRGFIKSRRTDSLQIQFLVFDPAEGEVLASSEHTLTAGNWKSISLETSLSEHYRSNKVLIALMANGSGSFWFDAVRIKIGGTVYGEGDPDFREPTEDEISRLNNKAIPFKINTPKKGNRDFKALSEIVGDARIVALGENSHGSSSIYKLKLRMLRYLVEQKGFSIFALEMPVVEADYINNYVQHDRGNIDEVIKKLTYPSWQTEEMIAIIKWMKQYNEQNEHDISFQGYDMQNGESALTSLKNFAANNDSTLLAKLGVIDTLYEKAMGTGNSEEALFKHGRETATYLEKKSYPEVSPEQITTMRHYIDIFMQYLSFRFRSENTQNRDAYMAENIRWIIENAPEARGVIISADNTHITEAEGKMGATLSRWYKQDYLSFGFTYKTGTYSAYGPEPFYEVHAPYVGTYEYFFSKSRHQNFLLDLRKTTNIPILNQEAGFRAIGSRPQEVTQFYEIDIKNHFDVIVYLEASTHTTYLKK